MGMPSPSWDKLIRETRASARRRKRRRRQRLMLWLLAGVTTAALVVVGVFVKNISKVQTAARPAALSAVARHPVPPRPSHRHARAGPAADRHRGWPVLSAASRALAAGLPG